MTRPEDDRLVAQTEHTHPDDSPLPAGPDARARAATPADGDAETLRARWRDIQAGFVDDPHTALTSADALVREALHATEVRRAETETLRQALQGYRTILESLLNGPPRH